MVLNITFLNNVIKKNIVIIIIIMRSPVKSPLDRNKSILAIRNIEDKIVYDINALKNNNNIDFDIFFKYLFRDCCGCLDKECNIAELSDTNVNNIMKRYSGSKSESESKLLEILDAETKVECNKIRVDVGDILKRVYLNIRGTYKSKIALVVKFIELFKKSGLIRKNLDMYFLLSSNMRFKWNNIKRLTLKDINDFKEERGEIFNELVNKYVIGVTLTVEQELLMIKSLFWYFRKVVVDSIVSDIIRLENLNIKAMSVGSTKLTSDYDITLDGTYKDNSRVIRRFDRLIEILFMDDSESVFDTNIYGVSFVKDKTRDAGVEEDDDMNKMVNEAFNKEHEQCGKFNYILSEDKDFIISQHIWAFVKLLLRLNKIQEQDEELYGLCLGELSNNLGENLYYLSAVAFINKYESDVNNYQMTVDDGSRFLGKGVDDDSKYLVSNFISYVNYNGSETYLTNGAFLDVVVNNQMCKKDKSNMIKLDLNSYLDSFIENLSDLITHYHKVKYLDRASDAFDKMLEISGFDTKVSCDISLKKIGGKLKCDNMNLGEYIKSILKMIKNLQTECSEDILECQSFIMMYYILYCIILVFKRYAEWSNISKEELMNGIKRFEKLDFKNFNVPVPIESKIGEIFNK
jgi:hypothetical protein|uniref:Uncharacterized protein n=1 Tax=viral metagenome TaxID=1070528 RepID=A0A6C0ALW0_9ZZZZ